MKPNHFEKLPQFTVIRDTYTVDGVLGEGAFGVVYKVRHKFLGIQALKVFHPEKITKQSENDLLNEAFILSKLTHPNVVRVFDANHFDWRGKMLSYVAMEYVAGGTLNSYLRNKGKLDPNLAVQIQIMICRGLAQGHQLNPPVIHRDVKPQNIMVDGQGENLIVKVSDFGQAKHVDPLTKLADSAGTLAYMAPEGFWNYKSPASDVYSAGIVFYIMLTGASPFKMPSTERYSDEQEVERTIRRSRSTPPKVPSELRRELDPRLDAIVMKALENDADKRYQDASEFLHALETYPPSTAQPLKTKISEALQMGRQYRDLPQAIAAMEAVLREASAQERQELMNRYGIILENWKKGII
jgi:serine/threonine protein kinase